MTDRVLSEGAALEAKTRRNERPAFAAVTGCAMTSADQIAWDAGFSRVSEISTCNGPEKVGEFAGMDIVASPIMPEGWIAIRGSHGALCIGPDGKGFAVPFIEPFKKPNMHKQEASGDRY